jgi:hypothetical protein
MENLPACAGLINKYFKGTVKHGAFVSDNGTVRVPLTLDPNIAWKAMSNKFLNHNVRRDIYAAWNVLRTRCGGKGRGLTACSGIARSRSCVPARAEQQAA